ncbi:MAG: regulatory iron-sulfur-containing complex subunit RicT [Bacteroidota bacterium]
MGCEACNIGTNEDGTPRGCGSKGSCGTGSCNRMSTYDWLSHLGVDDSQPSRYVEVSFKEGASKSFYKLTGEVECFTGDTVAVESRNGYNVGRITLSGELVRLQMKKKGVQTKQVKETVLRIAHQADLDRLQEARSREVKTMVRARAIARSQHLEMKITDVEYQGDGRKATIYYTADKRVDFRELIRAFAHEFRVKIEMRQIGSRQESARLGGIGSCGRELCCSTWLSSFQSVNIAAARYQNLAINQAKLSGQCGRLKCCLNYELDTYMEALEAFPKKADKLKTDAGLAILIKTDIFKQIMYYTYRENRGLLYAIPVSEVHRVVALNKEGKAVRDLATLRIIEDAIEEPGYGDVTGAVELPAEKRRRKKRKKRTGRKGEKKGEVTATAKAETPSGGGRRKKKRPATIQSGAESSPSGQSDKKEEGKKSKNKRRRRNNRRRKGRSGGGEKKSG